MMYLLFLHCQVTSVPNVEGGPRLSEYTIDHVVTAVCETRNDKIRVVNAVKDEEV